VDDLAVEIFPPVALDDERQKKAGDEEEVRHPERPGKRNHIMHEAFAARVLADAERRMHHHDQNDANALGIVDPRNAGLARRGKRCSVSHALNVADRLLEIVNGHAECYSPNLYVIFVTNFFLACFIRRLHIHA
jgi:hypothetical protein